ncbi:MAG: hypothetical protein LBP31_01270 [Holosporales bacterium]|nr:hypothetical protein [Holosporales bacterium]
MRINRSINVFVGLIALVLSVCQVFGDQKRDYEIVVEVITEVITEKIKDTIYCSIADEVMIHDEKLKKDNESMNENEYEPEDINILDDYSELENYKRTKIYTKEPLLGKTETSRVALEIVNKIMSDTMVINSCRELTNKIYLISNLIPDREPYELDPKYRSVIHDKLFKSKPYEQFKENEQFKEMVSILKDVGKKLGKLYCDKSDINLGEENIEKCMEKYIKECKEKVILATKKAHDWHEMST